MAEEMVAAPVVQPIAHLTGDGEFTVAGAGAPYQLQGGSSYMLSPGGGITYLQLRESTGVATTDIAWHIRMGPFVFKALDNQNILYVNANGGSDISTLSILDG